MPSYFIKWVIIHYFYWFWCSNCPQFCQWQPLQASYFVVLRCPQNSLSAYQHRGTKTCSRLILFFLCSPHMEIFLTLLWLRHLVQGHHFDQKPSLTAWLGHPHRLPSHMNSLFTNPRASTAWTASLSLSPTPPAWIPPCPSQVLHLLLEGTPSPPTQAPIPLTKFPSHEVSLLVLIRLQNLVPGNPPTWTPSPWQLVSTHCDTWGFPLLSPRAYLLYHLHPGGDICLAKPTWI